LAIDTATARAGVGLYDGHVVADLNWPGGREGSRTLLPAVRYLLELTGRRLEEVAGVAVTLGPGSFTALRVGLSTAKGLAYGLGCPILGVPTLDVVAYPHHLCGQVVWAFVNAGRGRLVGAPYRRQGNAFGPIEPAQHGPAADLIAQVRGPALVTGELSGAVLELLAERHDLVLAPLALRERAAAHLAEVGWQRLARGEQDDPFALEPRYVHTS
jgi:tRNA threonylcarbamoyladenosine biosynthesis protein TsaB